MDGRVSPACPGALIALRVDLGIPCLLKDEQARFEGRCKFLTFSYSANILGSINYAVCVFLSYIIFGPYVIGLQYYVVFNRPGVAGAVL